MVKLIMYGEKMLRYSWGLLLLVGSRLMASPIQGFYTAQGDWELACDNLGTCRAAGYTNAENSGTLSMSLLLQRAAGEQAAVSGRLKIRYEDDLMWWQKAPELRVNGHPAGQVVFTQHDDGEDMTKLSATQTQILLSALKRHANITLHGDDGNVWQLSANGATAIMRRMDTFQRRNGTPSALISRGRSHRPVLQPQPMPVIHAAAVPEVPFILEDYVLANGYRPPKSLVRVLKRQTPQYRSLVQKLRRLPQAEFCDFVSSPEQDPKIEAYRLGGEHMLIKADCIVTAYNDTTQLAAVTNNTFSRIESVFSNEVNQSYQHDGIVSSGLKGRGFGDCWGGESWIWDGRKFSLVESATGQMCRGFVGGAWWMPTFISQPVGTQAADQQAVLIMNLLKSYAD